MGLSSLAGATTYATTTAADANLAGAVFVDGYVWWNDGYNSVRAFCGTGGAGTSTWYFVMDNNTLEFWVRKGAGFTLSKLGLGAGMFPQLQTWCYFCGGIDTSGAYAFGCETAFGGGYTESTGPGVAPSTGVPGTSYAILNCATFTRPICALSNVRVWQLGAGSLPSANVRARLRLSRGMIRHIPGASLESHVSLIGPPAATTDTIGVLDSTGRTWSSAGLGTAHTWVDSPHPRGP